MGLLQRLFKGVGVTTVPKVEEIHVHDLLDWLEGLSQKAVAEHRLKEEAEQYLNALKNHRWLLESKRDGWKRENLTLPEVEKMLALLQLSGIATVEKILDWHTRLEPLLERLSQSSIPEHPPAEKERHSFLQQEAEKISGLKEEFEQKVILSGFSKIRNLMEKAVRMDDTTDRLRELNRQLQGQQERLQQLETKRREKEAELAVLQQRPEYNAFIQLKPERQQLLQEIERTQELSQRFERREELRQLEKRIGNKEFLAKLDEAYYRLEHFASREQALRKELEKIEDELAALKVQQQREIEFFTNLVKISLGKEMAVKV